MSQVPHAELMENHVEPHTSEELPGVGLTFPVDNNPAGI